MILSVYLDTFGMTRKEDCFANSFNENDNARHMNETGNQLLKTSLCPQTDM